MTMIQLYLLGTFRVTTGDPPTETRVSVRHGRYLLLYLALHAHTTLARSHVAGTLFPEMPEERARRLLSQTIWRLRNVLPREVIVSSYDTISLGQNVWVDLVEFSRLAQGESVEDWQQAVTLYKGDLCPDCYEDWALTARERVRETYITLLDRLVHHHKRGGQYEQALAYAREIVRLEPFWEQAHRELIHLYLIQDRPTDALRQYEALRALLQEELGVEPSPELQTLYQRIRAHVQGEAGPSPASLFVAEQPLRFVGRRKEREHILDALDQTHRGQGGFIFVQGAPGMGKSRLLQEAREGATWRGMLVGYGQATSHTFTPYSPLREALEEALTPVHVAALQRSLPEVLLGAAAHLWPVLGKPARHVRARQIHNAIVQVILTLARTTPLLLILDDVHNADPQIFDILGDLTPSVYALPCQIVIAFRPLEAKARSNVWSALLVLDRKVRPLYIHLSELDEQERRLLIAAALNTHADAPVVDTLLDHVDGVPLHILETLRYLHRRGILVRTPSGEWDLTSQQTSVPPTVAALVQQRLSRLPAPLRQAVEFLSVMGERIPAHTVTYAMGENAPAVVHDLTRHGFLINEGETYRFSHEIVREAIYQAIPSSQRCQLHQRAAEMFKRQQPVPWDQVALHLQQAGKAQAAVRAHLLAAHAASNVHSHNRVLQHCQMALTIAEQDDPTVCDLWMLSGQTHNVRGESAEARQHVARAIVLARCFKDNARLADACLLAGRVSIRDARFSAAARFLHRAYDLYANTENVAGMVEACTSLADVYESKGELETAEMHIEQAIRLTRKHALSEQRPKVLSVGATLASRQGKLEEAKRLYEEASTAAQAAGDIYVHGRCLNGLGLLYLEQRQYARAEVVFSEVLNIAREIRDRHNESVTLLNLAVCAANAGRLQTGLTRGLDALEMAQAAGNWRTQILALSLLGAVYTAWGSFADARAHLEEGARLAQEKGFTAGATFIRRNLGIWAREQGQLDEAIHWGEEALSSLIKRALWEKVPMTAYALGVTLLEAGAWARAEEVLQQGLNVVRAPIPRAFLLAALAWAHASLGKTEQAQEEVKACFPVLEQVGEDRELPRAWFHVAQAAQVFDPTLHIDALRKAYLTLRSQCLHLPEERQHAFLHLVLSHRLITQGWLGAFARPRERLRLYLPRRNGRGMVAVVWTVDAGDEDTLVEVQQGPIALRRHRLRRLLREAEAQGARATHEALAQALGVSVPTVRRDLRTLRNE